MFCKKCGGRVFLDRMFVGKKKKGDHKSEAESSPGIELYCVLCGKRWMLHKEKNRLAEWLHLKESQRSAGYATSTSK